MRGIPTGAAGGLGVRGRTETNHLLSARSRPPRNPAAAADNARCHRTGTWRASRGAGSVYKRRWRCGNSAPAPPRGLQEPRPPAAGSLPHWLSPRFLRRRKTGGTSRPAPPHLRRPRSRSPALPPRAPAVGGAGPSNVRRGRSGAARCTPGRARAGRSR